MHFYYAGPSTVENAYAGHSKLDNAYAGPSTVDNAYAGPSTVDNAYADSQVLLGNLYMQVLQRRPNLQAGHP